MKRLDIYIASSALLIAGLYLKSGMVCIAGVILWGISVAENVLAKAAKDAEIMMLVSRAEAYEKRLKVLEMDLINVAERAKTILGENF
jgi:hypothetical protein